MKKLTAKFHSLNSKVRFHAERLGLMAARYPNIIVQKDLDVDGIRFEVHNIGEANRVRFLDDEGLFLKQLLDELTADDIFFDVGACIGMFSMHAAKRCRQVVAFEPDPGFRQHLNRNLEINHIENATVFPYAISDRTGVFPLFSDGTNGKSPSLENNNFQYRIDVETRTLSELVFQAELPAPTVIKIDIEGAEVLAFRGMDELLRKKAPRLIFLEMHPTLVSHFGSNASELLLDLERAGYYVSARDERDDQVHYILRAQSAAAV